MTMDNAMDTWSPPDASFSKKILKRGSGSWTPNDGATCSVCITPVSETGSQDMSQFGYPLGQQEIILGDGCGIFSNMLDACLETMHHGEECQLFVREKTCVEDSDGNCADSVRKFDRTEEAGGVVRKALHIILHNFTRSKDVHQMSAEEKLDRAVRHKNHGTQCFKDGNHKLAERFYIKALRYIISVCILPNKVLPLDDEIRQQYYLLKRTCSLNLAACQLKCQRFEDVIKHCTCALEKDHTNIKALYRRCQAYIAVDEFESARADIQLALIQDPRNKMILEQNRILVEREKQEYGKLSRAMNKMFGGPPQPK